mgnify:CR=1 FL=1
MVKSNLMIPFILRNVNVRLFRRYCSVLSDEGVQFETARVFNSIAVFIGIWGYEEDMPDELKDKC